MGGAQCFRKVGQKHMREIRELTKSNLDCPTKVGMVNTYWSVSGSWPVFNQPLWGIYIVSTVGFMVCLDKV